MNLFLICLFFYFLFIPNGTAKLLDSVIDQDIKIEKILIEPKIFSPFESKNKRDFAEISLYLNRTAPIIAKLYKDGKEKGQFSSKDLSRGRYRWHGTDGHGKRLPDGKYEIKFFTNAMHNWRLGKAVTFKEQDKKQPELVISPASICVDKDENIYFTSLSSNSPIRVYNKTLGIKRLLYPHLMNDKGKRGIFFHKISSLNSTFLAGINEKGIFLISKKDGSSKIIASLKGLSLGPPWRMRIKNDKNGNILISDETSERIILLSATGKKLLEIKGVGKIYDIASDTKGNIYAACPKGIKVFKKDGSFLHLITIKDKDFYLNLQGLLNTYHCFIEVAEDGSFIIAIKGLNSLERYLHEKEYVQLVKKIGFDPISELDTAPRLYHVSASGEIISRWGRGGCKKDEFIKVEDLCLFKNRVFAVDSFANKITVTDLDGQLLDIIETPLDIFARPHSITRIGQKDRFAIFDWSLHRCTIIDSKGKIIRDWSTRDYEETLDFQPKGFSDKDGNLYLANRSFLFVVDEFGRLKRKIELERPPSDWLFKWGGMYVFSDGKMLLSPETPELWSSPSDKAIRHLFLYDKNGHLLKKLLLNEARIGGPLRTDGKGSAFIPCVFENKDKRPTYGIVQLDLNSLEFKRKIISEDSYLENGFDIFNEGFIAGCRLNNCDALYFNKEGKALWAIKNTGFTRTLLSDGKNVFFVCNTFSSNNGWIDNWGFDTQKYLGSAFVTIDNTPPIAKIDTPNTLITTADAPLSIRGEAQDKNFDHFELYYMLSGNKYWSTVQNVNGDRQVFSHGELFKWKVPQYLRNKGIRLKLVVWDKAGNKSEFESGEFIFDDDGDGLSNSWEIAHHSDPHAFTQTDLKAHFKGDMRIMTTAYFRAGANYRLKMYLYNRDKDKSEENSPVSGARIKIQADGGKISGSDNSGIAFSGTNRDGSFTFYWDAPEVPLNAIKLVTFTVTLPSQSVNNKIYDDANTTFTVLVLQDDDNDLMPDSQEIAQGDNSKDLPFRNNPDSDGDGVVDGIDIAPRTSYEDLWSTVYEPGMIRFTKSIKFFGIGGDGSKALKKKKETKGIVKTPQIDVPSKMLKFANKMLFNRNPDGSLYVSTKKISPFKIIRWLEWDDLNREDERYFLNTYIFGNGHFKFIYYAEWSKGTGIVENVEAIDTTDRKSPSLGFRKNYLNASLQPATFKADRNLLIQWRFTVYDPTKAPDSKGRFTKLAWIVEAFDNKDLKASGLLFSTMTVGVKVDDKNRLYQARLRIPGDRLPINKPIYLELTPCLFIHNPSNKDAPDSFKPFDHKKLKVSGIQEEVATASVKWIKRLKARPGHEITLNVFKKIIQKVESENWPVDYGFLSKTVVIDGTNYNIGIVSIRNIPNLSNISRTSFINSLLSRLSSSLSRLDVIVLSANSPMETNELFSGISWPSGNSWIKPDITVKQNISFSGNNTDDNSGEDISEALTHISAGYETYKTVRSAVRLHEIESEFNWLEQDSGKTTSLFEAEPEDFDYIEAPEGNKVYLEPKWTRQTSVRKLGPDGPYEVKCDFIKNELRFHPGVGWSNNEIGRITHKEIVDNLSDSDIFLDIPPPPGTTAYKRMRIVKGAASALGVGASIVTNWLQVYGFYQEGDKVGVVLFGAAAAVDVASAAVSAGESIKFISASSKFQVLSESKFFSGIRVGTGVTKISPAAIVVGTIQTSYYGYKLHKAKTVWDKQDAARNMYASVVDTEIAAVEPWGAIIMASWFASTKATNFLYEKLTGSKTDAWVQNLYSTPGSAISFVLTDIFTDAIPADMIKKAANYALRDARETVKRYNRNKYSDLIFILVRPNDEK